MKPAFRLQNIMGVFTLFSFRLFVYTLVREQLLLFDRASAAGCPDIRFDADDHDKCRFKTENELIIDQNQ